MNVDPIYEAFNSGQWYALSGLLVSFLLMFARTRTDLTAKLSGWQQWALGLAVAGAGAFATAQASGHPPKYALTAVVVATVSAAMGMLPGVGHKAGA